MPTVMFPIMEVPEHIFKPVIEQVSFRLLQNLDLVDVIKDNIYINADFMGRTQTSTLEKDAIINVESLRVDTQIQMNPTSQKWDVYNFSHTAAYGITRNFLADPVPIYRDMSNSIRAVEILTPVTIAMTFAIQLESATLAYSLPSLIYNLYGTSGLVHYEDLFFDYPIPKELLHVLHGVYKLDRINGKEAGVEFMPYLANNSDGSWTTNTNRNIKDSYEIVRSVRNLQSLVAAEYSEDRPSVNKMEQGPNAWEIQFTLQLQFGMPSNIVLHYPISICNRLLPREYIPLDNVSRYNRALGRFNSSALTANVEMNIGLARTPILDPGIAHVPHYDDWVPPSNSNIAKYGHFVIAAIGVLVDENETLHTVLNLKEFEDDAFSLAPFLIEILQAEGPLAVYPNSLVSLTMFANDDILTPRVNFKVSKGLVLSFNGTAINKQYRLCISICRDLSKLDPRWYYLLIKFYEFFDIAYRRRIDAFVRKGTISGDYEEDEDGNIIDGDGNVVGNVDDPYKPEEETDDSVSSTGPVTGGFQNGIYQKSRIIRANIITHRSS